MGGYVTFYHTAPGSSTAVALATLPLTNHRAEFTTTLPGLGDEAHRAVTLRQLLHATSGAEVNQVRGLNFVADDSRARDWFAQPIVHEPGSYYFYDQTATSVIVMVTQNALGQDYQDFAQSALFDNLGIRMFRTLIRELPDLSDHGRELILLRRSSAEIKRAAREEGMIFLRESAVQKALAGHTTLQEINKVTFVEVP